MRWGKLLVLYVALVIALIHVPVSAQEGVIYFRQGRRRDHSALIRPHSSIILKRCIGKHE